MPKSLGQSVDFVLFRLAFSLGFGQLITHNLVPCPGQQLDLLLLGQQLELLCLGMVLCQDVTHMHSNRILFHSAKTLPAKDSFYT